MRYIKFTYWLNDDTRTACEEVPDTVDDSTLNMFGEDYMNELCEEYGIGLEEIEEPEELPDFYWEEISEEEYENEI